MSLQQNLCFLLFAFTLTIFLVFYNSKVYFYFFHYQLILHSQMNYSLHFVHKCLQNLGFHFHFFLPYKQHELFYFWPISIYINSDLYFPLLSFLSNQVDILFDLSKLISFVIRIFRLFRILSLISE